MCSCLRWPDTGVDARVQGLRGLRGLRKFTSVTSVTGTPAAAMVDAVEPVGTSATPASCAGRGRASQTGLVVDGNEGAAQGTRSSSIRENTNTPML